MSAQPESSSPLPFRPAPTAPPESSSPPPSPFEPSDSALALAHANRQLSENNPQASLDIYTEVLYELDPGHPVALLNRSLCYLLLGYPHLTVTDAHRALFCLRILNERNYEHAGVWGEQLFDMGSFIYRTEPLQESWLEEPNCYVCNGALEHLNVRLASIADKLDIKSEVKGKPKDEVKKIVTVRTGKDLILKAYYRLALGLWRCGGGAWKSALNVLCAALDQAICSDDDKKDFINLQNTILMHMNEEMQNEAAVKQWLIQSGAMKSDKAALKAFDESGARGLFMSEFTKIRRELYPWDEHSLTWKNIHDVIGYLNIDTRKKTGGNCKLEVIGDRSKAPKLTLSARRDISAAQTVFHDTGLLHAVTPRPKFRHNFNCDTCGSLLNVSKELCNLAVREARDLCDELDYHSTKTNEQLVFRHCSSVIDPEFVPKEEQGRVDSLFDTSTQANNSSASASSQLPAEEQPSEIPRSSSPHPPKGFQLCPVCRAVCFCSQKCHQLSVSTHGKAMCLREADEIVNSKDTPQYWSGLVNADAQNLLNLLLFRVIGRAACVGEHPLQSYNMKILDGDLANPRRLPKDGEIDVQMRKKIWTDNSSIKISNIFTNRPTLNEIQEGAAPNTKQYDTMPWSYTTNVVEPIEALYRLGKQNHLGDGGLELALDTQSFDGWVLETMRAKVASSMTMSKYPRFAVTFDDVGDCVARACVGPSSVSVPFAPGVAPKPGSWISGGVQGAEERVEVENSWIGSLHPFYTLLDPAGDGLPNVVVYERRGALLCKSVSNEDAHVVVKKGERFRRSEDVVLYHKGDDNLELALPESFEFPSISDAEESWDKVDDDVLRGESSDSSSGTD